MVCRRVLVNPCLIALAPIGRAHPAGHECLVHLDIPRQWPRILRQQEANLLQHPVSRLVGHADFASELLRADPALGRGD